MTDTVQFTQERFNSFETAYDTAVKNEQFQFEWEGHNFVTQYAKYMREHLINEGMETCLKS